MYDILSNMPTHEIAPLLIAVVAAVTGTVISVTAIVAVQLRKYRQSEIDAGLKQDMLNRGMPAHEIAQVMDAGKRNPSVDVIREVLRPARHAAQH